MRRVYYDLTGLPPTPAEAAKFLDDASAGRVRKAGRPPARFAALRRALGAGTGSTWCASPRRTALSATRVKPHAWRYRDYVIRSLNDDKPYDQFVREQLAGDELDAVTKDSIIATGFYRLGLWDDEPADKLQAKYDVLDDVVATTAQAFLGLTLDCARCHDHKIDPITQKDYYSLLAFFHGVTPMAVAGKKIEVEIFDDQQQKALYESRLVDLEERRDQVQSKITAIETDFESLYNNQAPPADAVESADLEGLEYRFYREQWDALPDFELLRPESVAFVPSQLIRIDENRGTSDIGYVFFAGLKVPRDGEYEFTLDSDDGSRLILDDRVVIDHDGLHELGSPKRGSVSLAQGPRGTAAGVLSEIEGAWNRSALERTRVCRSRVGRQGQRGAQRFAPVLASRGAAILGRERYSHYQELVKKLDELKREKVPVDRALAVTEVPSGPPATFVLLRGNAHTPVKGGAGVPVDPGRVAARGARAKGKCQLFRPAARARQLDYIARATASRRGSSPIASGSTTSAAALFALAITSACWAIRRRTLSCSTGLPRGSLNSIGGSNRCTG